MVPTHLRKESPTRYVSNIAVAFVLTRVFVHKEIIFSNTLQSMRVILDAMEFLDIPLADASNARRAEVILSLPSQIDSERLPAQVTDAVAGLWKDEGVQTCFLRSREFQLNDSAK